jgi:hypothetical protein
MTKRVLSAAASAALLLAFATGCGGDGGGRPSVDEVADGIQDNMGASFGGDVTDEMATCIAKAFHESDLSDDALQAIADGDKDYDASKDDTKAIESVSTESVTKCVGTEVPDAELPDTEE